MVDAVYPRVCADEGSAGTLEGKPVLLATLRAFARRLLWTMHESRRRRAAIFLGEYAHLFQPHAGEDDGF
jgi:hypothetical protein